MKDFEDQLNMNMRGFQLADIFTAYEELILFWVNLDDESFEQMIIRVLEFRPIDAYIRMKFKEFTDNPVRFLNSLNTQQLATFSGFIQARKEEKLIQEVEKDLLNDTE